MRFSRKIILFGLFLLIISGLVLLGALRQEKERISKPPSKNVTDVKYPKESISNLPIKIGKNSKINTPNSLSPITIKLKFISKEQSENIANILGFKEQIKILKDVTEGEKYFWSNNNNYLWITPNKSYMKFGLSQFPTDISNNEFTDQDYENFATDFINEKFELDKNIFVVSSVSYYKLSPKAEGFAESIREEAQLFHVDLTYKSIGSPVLTSIPRFQLLFVEILPNGEVYKAGAYLIDEIKHSDKSYQVKTLDDIKDSIDQAHLISVENDYIYLNDIEPSDIKNVDIENIEVGYYFDDINMNTTLQPIFLLEGEIEIKDSTADWAKLYMPALK